MQAAAVWVLIFVLVASALGIGPGNIELQAATPTPDLESGASEQQTNALVMMSPSACPPGGCAGGQRLGMRFEFDLTAANYVATGPDPNVKICVYAFNAWNVDPGTVTPAVGRGEISEAEYSAPATPGCAEGASSAPSGYELIYERVATLPANLPDDALRFQFRLGKDAAANRRLYARLFARTSSGWSTTPAASAGSQIMPLAVPPAASTAYVANDGAACGSRSPCYVNSDGSGANGLGTGLKDAVDAATAGSVPDDMRIIVAGSYTIKSETVLVNKKLSILGSGDATITYTGPAAACGNAMLTLTAPITVRNVNINSGSCTSTGRDLLLIDSRGAAADNQIVIESNDLTGGTYAVHVTKDSTARLVIRYNHITGNIAQAIYYETGGSPDLEVVANNITGNASPQIICAGDVTDPESAPLSNRIAEHNYWGYSAPGPSVTHCSLTAAKRLGSPIALNATTPGVRASRVVVTNDKKYPQGFSDQIAYRHTGPDDVTYLLYLIDHGYMISPGAPFSGLQGGESPSPCSNFWDVFLASPTLPDHQIELYFKYFDKTGDTPGCLAVINSAQYCEQTTSQAKYPLFWLDPAVSGTGVTKWWDPVGARPENLTTGDGQETECHIEDNEIQVTLDKNASNRPNLTDLGYTPFMVGIPVIKSFKLFASSQNVRIEWVTNNEPDIAGFNILRGTELAHLTQINGDLIDNTGDATYGDSYYRTDTGRVNGTKYYYRLEVVRSDGNKFYSAIESVTVNAATSTSPPPTRTPTQIQPTRTRTMTRVPTSRPTQIPTRTYTAPARTRTPTATRMVLPTLTRTLDLSTPGIEQTLTALASTPEPTSTGFGEEFPTEEIGTPGGEETVEGTVTPEETAGTEIAMVDTPTQEITLEPSATATALEVVSGATTRGTTTPWLSLLLGLLAGLALVGGAGGWWYYSSAKK